MNVKQQKERYQNWLKQAKPLLKQKKWKEVFSRHPYPFVVYESAPFVRLKKELRDCKVALITSSGIYLKGQQPFDTENIEGDWSYRELPNNLSKKDILIAHDHYDHRYANEDINCVFPIDRFLELEREGAIGELASTAYSFMGYIPNITSLFEQTVPEITEKLKAQNVDVTFLVPV